MLRDVERTYSGPPLVCALSRFSLNVCAGEYVAITGPSGAGKSTLLNVLGLLDRPTSGSYEFDGMDVAALPERDRTALRGARIGFVFQAFHLLPYRTALENVMLAQIYNGSPRAGRYDRARSALEQVGMLHRMHALPGTLSGGEQQRVAIARALVNRPAILLCDEPTGNLDSANSEALLELFAGLNRAGLTLIVITHDPRVAAGARRRLAILDGMLEADQPTPQAPVGRAATP